MDIFRTPIGRYAPGILNVIIEIPKASRKRFRYHRKRRTFVVDYRLMVSAPGEFGWIPQTWTQGGKRLNAVVLAKKPTWGGNVCQARPIGALRRRDGDHQILCALLSDESFADVKDISDVDEPTLRRLVHFYEPFFPLEGWMRRSEAIQFIREATELFKSQSIRHDQDDVEDDDEEREFPSEYEGDEDDDTQEAVAAESVTVEDAPEPIKAQPTDV